MADQVLNTFSDESSRRIAQAVRRVEAMDEGATPGDDGRRGGQAPAAGTVVVIRNDSGAAVAQWAVLGIDGPLFSPSTALGQFQRRRAIKGIAPAATHAGRFAIVTRPLAAGAIGRAILAGVAPVQVDVTDVAHLFADVTAGDETQLTSGETGAAQLLYPATATGVQWCLVRVAPGPPAAVAAGLLWGRAITNWHNAAGNGSYVDVNPCPDSTGAGYDSGTTVRVYLPRSAATDPNVVGGQVLGYALGPDGGAVALTGYLDAVIGSVRMWSINAGDPPPGWDECITGSRGNLTMLDGTFPVGRKTGDADFGAVNNSGNRGRKTHCHSLLRDDPNPVCPPVWFDEGTYTTLQLSTSAVNHLPPWCVVRFIERVDNSV